MVQTTREIKKKVVKSSFKDELIMFLKEVTHGRPCFCAQKALGQPDKSDYCKMLWNENYWHRHTCACLTASTAVEMSSIATEHGNR